MLLTLVLGLDGLSANPPKIRRVCKNNTDNHIFYYPSDDTCSGFIKYYIWGNDGGGGPYVLIDSVSDKAITEYAHLGANPAGIPKEWSYYITTSDSCTMPVYLYSDTVSFDKNGPDTITLDSVSIDHVTNRVIMGWPQNKSPNFFTYVLYLFNPGGKTKISPPILRDTFLTDTTGSNPQLGQLTYDITSYDSCGVSQVFEFNSHSTIFLSGASDSCSKIMRISWLPYIGWSGVRSYHIYVRENAGPFLLIDSVTGPPTNFQFPMVNGVTYSIFVRGFSASTPASSSSNLIVASLRNRIEPASTYLSNASALDPDGDQFELSFVLNPTEEYSFVAPYYSTGIGAPLTPLQQIPAPPASTLLSGTYTTPDRARPLYFVAEGRNLCGIATDTSNTISSVAVSLSGDGTTNTVSWNKPIGWDSQVEGYVVYRGTNFETPNNNYTQIALLSGNDTLFTDSDLPENIGNHGICYYVEAVQDNFSSHGVKVVSRSFSACISGTMLVFVPNAFNPEGQNKTFRPEGSYINYALSSMEIYNRWGGLILQTTDITNGWDGKTPNGQLCEQGVYFYKLNLIGTDGQTQQKTGNVTLLN